MIIISIPYGAIKSHRYFKSSFVYIYISIPYGAIKSYKMRYRQLLAILFQFLMVRLKAGTYTWNAETNHISIPYGAIKSIDSKFSKTLKIVFQFLMVRLKDGWKVYIAIIIAYFNSLWCD